MDIIETEIVSVITHIMHILEQFVLVSVAISQVFAWINVHERLKNRYIHIESLRTRADWVHVSNQHDGTTWGYYEDLPSHPEEEVHYDCTLTYKIRLCGENYVCMESACEVYNSRYLCAGYPYDEGRQTVKLVQVNYPDGEESSQWTLECEAEDLESCRFTPRRFSDKVMVHHWQDGKNTPGNYYATIGTTDQYYKWRIFAPDPSDQQVQIFQQSSTSTVDQHYEKKVEIGISQTTSSTHTVTSTTTAEVGGAFKAFSASASSSISDTWTTASSQTYEVKTTITIKVTIPPLSTITVYQLIGTYAGRFSVGSEVYNTTQTANGKTTSKMIVNEKNLRFQKDEL